MFTPVEHMINGDCKVAVVIPFLSQQPVSWRPDGENGVWLDIPGMLEHGVAISKDALEFAILSKELLVIEFNQGEKNASRSGWIPLLD